MLPRDDPAAGELLQAALEDEGVEQRLGVKIERVEPGFRIHLAGQPGIRTDRVLVATGRQANTQGLGFEHPGIEISPRGIEVDDRLRAAEGVWACGDVTGIAMFTHVGKYHGRVAAADVAGKRVRANHRAIPAVTFTDPQVASVGQTSGNGLAAGEWRVDRVSRSSTYERPTRPGVLKLFAKSGSIVGALAVGPEAGEWLGQLTLAVQDAGSGERPPRHDPAVPDLLGGDRVRSAQASGRLVSKRPMKGDENGINVGDMARPLGLPDRHSRREAHLHRSVPR